VKVLIGYDGSKSADAALADLQTAGLPAKIQAKVVTVTTPWTAVPPEGLAGSRLERESAAIAKTSRKQAQAMAEQAAARLRKSFPGWKVTSEAVLDHPAEGLIRSAETWKADLVVLGTHGRSAFGRLLLGSVAQKVLNHAPCDVRIVRAGDRGVRTPRVLVAVDGSPGSDHAVAAAAAREWPKGTRIQVIAALDGIGLTDALRGIKNAALGAHKDMRLIWVERKSAAAVRRLAMPGLLVTTSVKVGDPRIVILREAKTWEADCIFLGSRGLAGIERFLLGSVTASVSVHAPCTVEVIRKNRGQRKARAGVHSKSIAVERIL